MSCSAVLLHRSVERRRVLATTTTTGIRHQGPRTIFIRASSAYHLVVGLSIEPIRQSGPPRHRQSQVSCDEPSCEQIESRQRDAVTGLVRNQSRQLGKHCGSTVSYPTAPCQRRRVLVHPHEHREFDLRLQRQRLKPIRNNAQGFARQFIDPRWPRMGRIGSGRWQREIISHW